MRTTTRPFHHRRDSGRSERPAPGGFTLIEMIIVIGVILLLTALTVTVIAGLSRRAEIRDTENTMRLMEQALSEWELATGRQITYGRSTNHGFGNEPTCPDGPTPQYELPQLEPADAPVTEDQALRESDMVWSILSRSSSSREIVARVNPDYFIELTPLCIDPNAPEPPSHFDLDDLDHLDDGGFMNCRIGYRFLDAWDNPILAVMPGRRYQQNVGNCNEDTAYCVGNMPNANCPDDDGTIRTPYENRFGIAANRRIFFVSAGPSGRFGDLHLSIARADLNDQQRADIELAADNIYSHEVIIEEGRPQP